MAGLKTNMTSDVKVVYIFKTNMQSACNIFKVLHLSTSTINYTNSPNQCIQTKTGETRFTGRWRGLRMDPKPLLIQLQLNRQPSLPEMKNRSGFFVSKLIRKLRQLSIRCHFYWKISNFLIKIPNTLRYLGMAKVMASWGGDHTQWHHRSCVFRLSGNVRRKVCHVTHVQNDVLIATLALLVLHLGI